MQYSKTFNILTIKIMKIFKFMTLALVAMLGFNSCSEDCDHNFIEYDYSKDLVGTWTCFTANYAEALVIKADGSVVSTSVENGEYWDGVKGSIKTTNNKMTLLFEDNDNYEGRFEMICGEAFTIFDENGKHLTYRYCANDLADEVVGTWVRTETPGDETKISIQNFKNDGKAFFTGYLPDFGFLNNGCTNYKVIGDLMIQELPQGVNENVSTYYVVGRMTYTPNSTLGDIHKVTGYTYNGEDYTPVTYTWLRIKDSLNLTGKTYDYSTAYVSNAKGTDEDFTILGHTFNIANITGGNFDMLFRSELFYIDLNANSIKQYYRLDIGQNIEIEIPITVDGNKVTLDMSNEHSAYRKVDMYMFQDADDSQLHMYMHTDAFINYFANMELYNLLSVGKINPDDTAAIEKVVSDMEARIESINVSFVMKARK